jgi:GH18 family chitinase
MKLTFRSRGSAMPIIAMMLITACGSGNKKSDNEIPTNNTLTVPSSAQVRSPVSANTTLGSTKTQQPNLEVSSIPNLGCSSSALAAGLEGCSPCIKLVQQQNGQYYQTKINSNATASTASVTLELTNVCSTPQSIANNIKLNNLKINGEPIPQGALAITQSGSPNLNVTATGGISPILTISSPSCTGTNCLWSQLAPGAKVSVTAGVKITGSINTFIIDTINNDIKPAPAPAPTPGTLNLNLTVPSATQAACSSAGVTCNFQVQLWSSTNTSSKSPLTQQSVSAAQGESSFAIGNLLPGSYIVQVVQSSIPSLTSGTIAPVYTPGSSITITSGATTTETVSFNYTANSPNPTPVASAVTVTLNTAGLPSNFSNNTIKASITDTTTGVIVGTGIFTSGTTSQIIPSSALVEGQNYSIQLQELGDPQTGQYFKAPPTTFTAASTLSAVTTNQYAVVPSSNLYTASIVVPTVVAGQTIAYGGSDSTGSNLGVSYTVNSLTAGTYTFPVNSTVTLTPNSIAGYTTTISPNTITSASSGSSGQTITVTNTAVVASPLTYQYSCTATSSAGICNSYVVTITNNSANTISYTGLSFVLRADSGMQNVLTTANMPNSTPYMTYQGNSTGQCYGVNNGVCDVTYTFSSLSWSGASPSQLAPGETIVFSNVPNGNTTTYGASTNSGIPLYLDFMHNIALIESGGNSVLATPYSIYNNLQNPSSSNKMIGAYFTDWTNYQTPSGRMYPVESAGINSFPTPNVNTIIYDLAYLNGGPQSVTGANNTIAGNMAAGDPWADPTYVEEFAYLRAAHPWMNLSFSIGGWGSGFGGGSTNFFASFPSENLQLIFEIYGGGTGSNPNIINTTAANMINTALMFGFNGIDIDFEQGLCSNVQLPWCVGPYTQYSGRSQGTIQWDANSITGYQALLTALHTYAQQITSSGILQGTTFNISTALPAGVNTIQYYISLGGSYDTVFANVDWANLMTYDYHGQFDAGITGGGVSDAMAGLNQSTYNYSGGVAFEKYFDINDTLNCTTSTCNGYQGYFGIPSSPHIVASKMNLGIPTYTRISTLNTAASSIVGSMYQTLAPVANQNWAAMGGGVVSYRCLYNNGGTGSGGYCAPSKTSPSGPQGDSLPGALTTSDLTTDSQWQSSVAMTPWFYYTVSGTPYFGSFDSGASAANKVNYAITHGLNGAFVWEIDDDIPMQDPNYSTYGLMYNICKAMNGGVACPTPSAIATASNFRQFKHKH